MSGGVDSSVAALLLKEKGYDVLGITLLIWESVHRDNVCCGYQALQDARVCAERIKIPHYPIDLRKEFKEMVVKDFLEGYRKGITPNPCIRCNQWIKFDIVREKLKPFGDGLIATGHYARIKFSPIDNRWLLLRARDLRYDQSYFLYSIPISSLPDIIFPLGDYSKEEVRELARRAGLITADKPKSEDLCFIPNKNYAEFLGQIYPEALKPGPVKDQEGKNLGTHKGIIYYTIGQRKRIGPGFGKRLYVIKIDVKDNAIIVGEEKDCYGTELLATDLNLFLPLPGEMEVLAKVRYKDKESLATIKRIGEETIYVKFREKKWAITPGQSIVFYDGEICLGGGIIVKAL